ncbi:MAG: hypothetical protein OXU83_02905, partial [Gammaproteobacteria bacterium]|nr:hypothetical protein [Gammaproteobacteria bacterium]
MKRLAAAALTLALAVAATAASAQPISLGTAANFGEGGSAGIVVRNDNPIVGVITVTFRVTFTGGPPEEDPGTLVRPSGGTQLSAFSGGVATGTDTIGSGHLSGNIQFFIEDVDHLPNGTTRVFTITLLSAMAGGDEIALHSDPALLSRSITITFSSTERRFSVSLAPASASVNVDRDSTAPGLQVDEDFGTSAHQVITFRVTLANVEGGRDVFDNDRASVNWAATVTGAGASGANGSDELAGVRSGTLNFRRDDDNDSADNYEEPQDVEVRVAHDTINEAAQTVVFTLTCSGGNCGGGGTGTGIGTGTATAGILASDPLTVSIGGDQTGNEGNTGDGDTQSDRDARRIRLTVTAAGATASDRDSVEIPFTIGGTAADATDYPASALQFPTGGDYYTLRPASGGARVVSIDLRSSRAMAGVDAFADIDVVPQLDDLNEADETVVITLSAPGVSGYATQGGSPAGAILLTGTASSRSATATINDDDG